MSLTQDKMRADIAEALEIAPEEITAEANLFDLGLDSMRLMSLVMTWQEADEKADLSEIWEHQTFAAWWGVVAAQHAGA
ncbi:phosphopantetheine-binding protein [Alloyangia pacifica]|nr:phosphopantetheine-binding protein [Alloyangia pacifica]